MIKHIPDTFTIALKSTADILQTKFLTSVYIRGTGTRIYSRDPSIVLVFEPMVLSEKGNIRHN